MASKIAVCYTRDPMHYPLRMLCVVGLLGAVGAAGCGEPEHHGQDLAMQLQAMMARTELRMSGEDPGDLRPEARRILAQLRERGWQEPLPGELNQLAFSAPPKTIKLWRRSKSANPSSAKSCDAGNVIQTISMEDYVKGVVPHEWILSWHSESLKAGAVAVRTYASYWVSNGGKYTCADLCDMAYSQVYKDCKHSKTDQAVDATKHQVMLKNGKLACTEYSAKNTQYPTWGGVKVNDTTTCSGESKYGHGRGMCQWGSSRWAKSHGKGYNWIVHHYYPGASLWSPTTPQKDTGVPPQKDTGVPPKKDTGGPPKKDTGGPPKKDTGGPPKKDTGGPPKKDTGGPPKKDTGTPWRDSGTLQWQDSAPVPPGWQPQNAMTLRGGCSVTGSASGVVWPLVLLLAALWRRRSA